MIRKKAFCIAAVRSGEGKTTLTLGIMAALVRRGLNVQPFKIGPDFIDPSLHQFVTGKVSYNLDLKMMGKSCCVKTFKDKRRDADVSVLEGVMGLFDGDQSSTAETVKSLGIPVFLIIDAKSCAESAVAILKGFESYDEEVKIAGVIFNKIGSKRHKSLIEREVAKKCNIPVIGYIKRNSSFEIPERHLGLFMANDAPLKSHSLQTLIETIENELDLDLMLLKSSCLNQGDQIPKKLKKNSTKKARKKLCVASDEAFCFYYPQNIELLEEAGFEIEKFSPVHDSNLPLNTDMIYLGGGYPELHAEKLSLNISMLDDIKRHHLKGFPIYGECGGFMYLCNELVDLDGVTFPMTGIFHLRAIMNKRLRRLGYRKATFIQECFLGDKGNVVYGHEFHYSHIVNTDAEGQTSNTTGLYLLDNNSYEGYILGSAIGSYVHLHFGQSPAVVKKMFSVAG